MCIDPDLLPASLDQRPYPWPEPHHIVLCGPIRFQRHFRSCRMTVVNNADEIIMEEGFGANFFARKIVAVEVAVADGNAKIEISAVQPTEAEITIGLDPHGKTRRLGSKYLHESG